jgi:hypothetical protein
MLITSLVIVLKPEAVVEPGLEFGIPFAEQVQPCPEICVFLSLKKQGLLTGLVDTDALLADRGSRARVTAAAAVQPV